MTRSAAPPGDMTPALLAVLIDALEAMIDEHQIYAIALERCGYSVRDRSDPSSPIVRAWAAFAKARATRSRG